MILATFTNNNCLYCLAWRYRVVPDLLACFHCFPNDQKPIKPEKGRKPFLFNQISLTKTPEIPHPADSENTAITQFKIKITEIPHEKLTNTANPNVPLYQLTKIYTTGSIRCCSARHKRMERISLPPFLLGNANSPFYFSVHLWAIRASGRL